MTTRTNNKPTHKLYAITKSANTDKGFWQESARLGNIATATASTSSCYSFRSSVKTS